MKRCPTCLAEYQDLAHECSDCKRPLVEESEILRSKNEILDRLYDSLKIDMPFLEKRKIRDKINWLELIGGSRESAEEKSHKEGNSPIVGYNHRVLLTLGKLMSGVGWAISIAAFFTLLVSTGQLMDGSESAVIQLVGSIPSLLLGLLTVAFGQQISCFVAIERNTRAIQQHLSLKLK